MKKSLCVIGLSFFLIVFNKNSASEITRLPNPVRANTSTQIVRAMQHRSLIDQNRPQIKALNATIDQFNQTIHNDPEVKKYYEDSQNCLQYIKGLSSTYNCQHDYIAKKLALEEARRRSILQQIDFTQDETDYGLGDRLYNPDFYVGYTMDWCYANLAEYVLVDSGHPDFFAELMK